MLNVYDGNNRNQATPVHASPGIPDSTCPLLAMAIGTNSQMDQGIEQLRSLIQAVDGIDAAPHIKADNGTCLRAYLESLSMSLDFLFTLLNRLDATIRG